MVTSQAPQCPPRPQDQQTWRDVLWRAWRFCEDAECATHLLALLADEAKTPVGSGWRLLLIFLATLAGMLASSLLGWWAGTQAAEVHYRDLGSNPLAILAATTAWGGVCGFLTGYTMSLRLTWQGWYASLPSRYPSNLEDTWNRNLWWQSTAIGYHMGHIGALSFLLAGVSGARLMVVCLVQYALLAWLAHSLVSWRRRVFIMAHLGIATVSVLCTLLLFHFPASGALSFVLVVEMITGIAMLPESTDRIMKAKGVPFELLISQCFYPFNPYPQRSAFLIIVLPAFGRLLLEALDFVMTHRHPTPATTRLGRLQPPSPTALEEAVRQACLAQAPGHELWTEVVDLVATFRHDPTKCNLAIAKLNSTDWIERLLARHTLIKIGGEAVPALVTLLQQRRHDSREAMQGRKTPDKHPLDKIPRWLLRDIATDTTTRLRPQRAHLLCPRCLARCGPHRAYLFWGHWCTWYGCRSCGQSRDWITTAHQVIAVLDTGMTDAWQHDADTLRINWLHRGAMFDFDTVEIVHAIDADIERFLVQVGNDTDPVRQARYATMRCVITSRRLLNASVLRLLPQRFGYVIWTPQRLTRRQELPA